MESQWWGLYLDDLGADLEGAGAQLQAGTVGVLSVDHADVSAASGWDHLVERKMEEEEGVIEKT